MNRVRISVDHISVVNGVAQGEGRASLALGRRTRRPVPGGSANAPASSGRGRLRGRQGERAGIVVAESSGILNFKPNKGKLIVVAEPDLDGGIQAGPLVADSISREFFGDASPSVTSSLAHALRAANVLLSRENLKSLSPDRRSVAVACAVVRDDDLYLAQIGPSLALRLRDGELAIIGEPLRAEPLSFACALGQDCEIEVQLYHDAINPGDILLLCSPSLLRMASGGEIMTCLENPNSAAIVENLLHLHRVSLNPEDFSAVALVVEGSGINTVRGADSWQRAGRRHGGGGNVREGRKGERNAEEGNVGDKDGGTRHGRAQGRSGADVRVGDGARDARGAVERAALGQRRGRTAAQGFAEPGEGEEEHRSFEDRRRGRGRAQSLAETDGVWSNTRPLAQRDGARRRRFDFRRILVFALIPLIFVGVAASVGIYLLQEYQTNERKEQALAILAKAAQAEQDAQGTQDIAIKRRLLSQADQLAEQAIAARPGDQDSFVVRERIHNALDQLSNGVRLGSARRLVDLGQDVKESDPTGLLLQGIDLYVLDRGADRIYKYLLDASGDQLQSNPNPVVVRRGDTIGDGVVGRIIKITWVPAGGQRLRDALVFIDDAGGVYEYDPTRGLARLKMTGALSPGEIQAVGGYAGSLYVLAPKQRQLVWYPPTAQGYEKSPYSYVNPETETDLTTAADFAVDSNLFVLHSTGKIERFYAGRRQQFDSATPDAPLKSPSAIFASPSARSVYVVDVGNQRVVQFSRDGHFERQLRYGGSDNIFRNLKEIGVDEQRAKLYVLSDRQVFVADLPK
ncbi:MAG: hypothetical protein HYY30_04290 [Chloroflexi bacterium]|nr:hypothetical protein [Chloroflexota bacterium]